MVMVLLDFRGMATVAMVQGNSGILLESLMAIICSMINTFLICVITRSCALKSKFIRFLISAICIFQPISRFSPQFHGLSFISWVSVKCEEQKYSRLSRWNARCDSDGGGGSLMDSLRPKVTDRQNPEDNRPTTADGFVKVIEGAQWKLANLVKICSYSFFSSCMVVL